TEIYTLSLHDALPISVPVMMPELSATFSKTRELPQFFFISLRAFCSVFRITALTVFFGNGCFALLSVTKLHRFVRRRGRPAQHQLRGREYHPSKQVWISESHLTIAIQ